MSEKRDGVVGSDSFSSFARLLTNSPRHHVIHFLKPPKKRLQSGDLIVDRSHLFVSARGLFYLLVGANCVGNC